MCRSKKNSMVQQICVLSNSSPQRLIQLTQMTCSAVPETHGESQPLNLALVAPQSIEGHSISCRPSQAEIQGLHQLGVMERRYTLENRKPSCSSDDSNGPHGSGKPHYVGPRPTLTAGHMEIPAALRNPQRKQSRVSVCKELSDMSDSPESEHYPTARKCSFMSRGLSEGKLASPSDSGDCQSGTDNASQHLSEGESPVVSPPPPAGGRRMSMVS